MASPRQKLGPDSSDSGSEVSPWQNNAQHTSLPDIAHTDHEPRVHKNIVHSSLSSEVATWGPEVGVDYWSAAVSARCALTASAQCAARIPSTLDAAGQLVAQLAKPVPPQTRLPKADLKLNDDMRPHPSLHRPSINQAAELIPETHPRKRVRLEDEQTTDPITSKVIPNLGSNAQFMSHRIGEERFPNHLHSLPSSPYIEPSPIISHAQWTGPAESNPLQRSTNFAIRVKLHYNDTIRGMVISSDDSWEAFNTAVAARLGNPPAGLSMEFEDPQEDDEKTLLQDRDDYQYALAAARASTKDQSGGRMRVWCSDKSLP